MLLQNKRPAAMLSCTPGCLFFHSNRFAVFGAVSSIA
jgi:hypothetical protein